MATGGKTLPAPPRLSGRPTDDVRVMQDWITSLYQELVLGTNVQGTLADHEQRIAALEAKVAEYETRIQALEP